VKIVFLKHISDCLKCDKVRDDTIDGFDGLNNIIKPFSSDLTNNKLLIIRRKLQKMVPFAIFLVFIHFFLNPSNGGLP